MFRATEKWSRETDRIGVQHARLHGLATRVNDVHLQRNVLQVAAPVVLLDDQAELHLIARAIDAAVGEEERGEVLRLDAFEARRVEA